MSVPTTICDKHDGFFVEWGWGQDVNINHDGITSRSNSSEIMNFDCPVCCKDSLPWPKEYTIIDKNHKDYKFHRRCFKEKKKEEKMKIYIVGPDGSGGEYGPSIMVKDLDQPENKCQTGHHLTKAFDSLEVAQEYKIKLSNLGWYAIISEMDKNDTEKLGELLCEACKISEHLMVGAIEDLGSKDLKDWWKEHQ